MKHILLFILMLFIFSGCNSLKEENTDSDVAYENESETIQENTEEPVSEKPEEFIITDELYEETFNDINSVINDLNKIIQRMDYDAWLTFLTDNYITETSKPSYLEKWDNDKNLQQKNIVIRSLKDYFDYLVVPRRSNVQLDEIEFKEENRVYAYTIINGVQYLLYNLLRTEDGWKIDFY